jgi:hypothetical protein
VARERPAAAVLHPARLALVVPELSDRQIQIAVAVEVASAHVGHARNFVDQYAPGERLPPVVLQHDDGPDRCVVREQDAEACDREVEVTVRVEVDGQRMRRPRDVGQRGLGERACRRLAYPGDAVGRRVTDDEIRQRVAVEIRHAHLRDERAIVGADREPCRTRCQEVRGRAHASRGALGLDGSGHRRRRTREHLANREPGPASLDVEDDGHRQGGGQHECPDASHVGL